MKKIFKENINLMEKTESELIKERPVAIHPAIFERRRIDHELRNKTDSSDVLFRNVLKNGAVQQRVKPIILGVSHCLV